MLISRLSSKKILQYRFKCHSYMRLGPCIGIFLWLLEWAQVEKEKSLSSPCANEWFIFLISLRYSTSWILNLWEFLGLTLCLIQPLSLSSCPLLGQTQVSRFIKSIPPFLNLKQTQYIFTCYLFSFQVSSWFSALRNEYFIHHFLMFVMGKFSLDLNCYWL